MSTTAVTIHGSGFKGPGFESGPSRIHVGPEDGETNVTNIVVVSDAIITCRFPERDETWPHKVDLFITTPHGTGHHPGVFEYSPPRPLTLYSIDPPYGLYTGGEPVVIIGSGFLGDEGLIPVTNAQFLFFGEITDLTDLVVISDTEIHANTPPGVMNRLVALRVFSAAEVAYLGVTDQDAFKYALPSLFGDVTPNIGTWSGGQEVTMHRLPGQILFSHLDTAWVSQEFGGIEYEIDFEIVDNDTVTYTMPNANDVGASPYVINGDPDFPNTGGVTINFRDAADIIRMKGYFNYEKLRVYEVTDPVTATGLGPIELIGTALDTLSYVEIGDNDSMVFFDVTDTLVIHDDHSATVTAPDLTDIVSAYLYVEGAFEGVGLSDTEVDTINFTVYSGFEPVISDVEPNHGPYAENTEIILSGANFAVDTPIACDSLDSSFQSATLQMYAGSPTASVGQVFTVLDGNTLSKARFFLSITGAPTGNVLARLYAHDDATTYGTDAIPAVGVLATSDPIDVTTLSADPTLAMVEFVFSGLERYRLDTDLYYVIAVEYTDGGDLDNCVNVGIDDATDADHDGNLASFDGVTWTADATDMIFEVETQGWVYRIQFIYDGGGPGDLDFFVVDSDAQITAQVPAADSISWADGRHYQIKAYSQYGNGSTPFDDSTLYFEYKGPPILMDIDLATGTTAGGQLQTITVDDTTGCISADMDGVDMPGFTIIDGTTIQAFTPPHAAGAVDTHVTNAAGTSSAGAGFTYV